MEGRYVEEFSELGAPEAAGERDGVLGVNGSPPLRRAETWEAGGQLLPEDVYPVRDGRLVSQSALARAGRWVQDRLDSGPERVERWLDMRLRALPRRPLRRGPRLVASLSPKGGTGKTSVSLLVAQVISTLLRWPVLVVDTDFTAGTAREHIPSDGQSQATLLDALAAIRNGEVRGPTDLAQFMCVIPGGAHLLAAPKDPEQLSRIDEEGMRELLEALRAHYPVTIMDCAPGIGLRDRAQKLTHELASDLLAVVLPRRVDAEQARWTLGYMALEYQKPLTVVINRMPRRPDEGARSARRVLVDGERAVARMELPHDETLQRQLDAAVLDVDRLHQATRIAVKQLVVSLAETWV